MALTENGGNNDDILIGSDGADTLDGGANNDFADGRAGIDTGVNNETQVNIP